MRNNFNRMRPKFASYLPGSLQIENPEKTVTARLEPPLLN